MLYLHTGGGDMKDISLIDKNFKVETKLNLEDIKFYNVLNSPFSIYGVFMKMVCSEECLSRLPKQ